MHVIALGRQLRMVRIRRAARQSDVARKAGLSATVIGRHESGEFSSVSALEQHATAIGLRLEVRLIGRAGELDRFRDEEHAAIVQFLAARFRAYGWAVEPEASFSEWGERGRIDLLAFDPRARTLVIVEVKTLLLDLGDLLGKLNVKERLAPTMAKERGWQVARVVTVLAVASTSANRGIVRSHEALFAPFLRIHLVPKDLAAKDVVARSPRILCWITPGAAGRADRWVAGRQRVRVNRGEDIASGLRRSRGVRRYQR